jgi:predicted nucleotidyltransferase
MSVNLDTLERVANRLGALRWEVVFVGGAVSDLLISDPGAPPPRMTGDIDAVVGVTSLPDYYEFSRKLKAAGFVEDRSPDAPVCRWLVDGTKVDLMPSDASVLGFSNRWYADTLRHARTTRLPGGTEVRVITGPYFIATKLEAFSGRGRGDHAASHDIEDVIAVIDGRPELVEEVLASPSDLRAYLSQKFGSLLRDQRFLDSVPGHLPPDEASQERLGIVLDRMQAFADSA